VCVVSRHESVVSLLSLSMNLCDGYLSFIMDIIHDI
jgi:hypothetical protein